MSRGERSRTLGWAYMMSPGSGEWSRPIKCPISCRASTRTSSGANGCPLASKVARVTTPPVRCPSSSHCRSVCPERSPSNWIRHWTRTSAELESASRLNRYRIRRVVEADQVPDLVQGEHADVVGRERLPFGIEGGEGDDASGQVSVVVPLQVGLPGTLPFELDTPLDPHFGGTGVRIEVEPISDPASGRGRSSARSRAGRARGRRRARTVALWHRRWRG